MVWRVLKCCVTLLPFYLATISPDFGDQPANGEELYNEHCRSCHQKNGKGFFRVYPPLTDSGWVADDQKIIGNLLNGLKGPIVVNGKDYEGEMPSFRYLTDEEIALIVNYIREDIAETGAVLKASEVARLRPLLQSDSVEISTK